MFIEVEYDLDYTGGKYSGEARFAPIRKDTVDLFGVREAFRRHTGIDPIHITGCSEDELYDIRGVPVKP